MEKLLNSEETRDLRNRGVLEDNEIAYVAGDLILAENVLTKCRRIISQKSVSESKRLLKG